MPLCPWFQGREVCKGKTHAHTKKVEERREKKEQVREQASDSISLYLPLNLPQAVTTNCPRDCYNTRGQGTCNTATGVCSCAAGFKGADCFEAISCPNDCSGHGTF